MKFSYINIVNEKLKNLKFDILGVSFRFLSIIKLFQNCIYFIKVKDIDYYRKLKNNYNDENRLLIIVDLFFFR